jgi:hypothetical protein
MTAATFILHLQNAFVAALALPALMCPVWCFAMRPLKWPGPKRR